MKINASITNLSLIKSCGLAVTLSLFAFSAAAAPLPYANSGTENATEYSFIAATSGDIVAFFAGRGGADYTNMLTMSVNGVDSGVLGLNNQSSAYGQSLNLGFANAGDTIVFSLKVTNTHTTWYSDKSLNSDGANHIYSAAFAGDQSIPGGIYVGFEDLTKNGNPASDFNYLDEQFVVTNVSAPTIPVPAATWLFGSGLLGLAGITRRRSKNS